MNHLQFSWDVMKAYFFLLNANRTCYLHSRRRWLANWYNLVKSLQLIWRLGTCRFHLRVPDIQMDCSDLTKMRGYQFSSPINGHQVDMTCLIGSQWPVVFMCSVIESCEQPDQSMWQWNPIETQVIRFRAEIEFLGRPNENVFGECVSLWRGGW